MGKTRREGERKRTLTAGADEPERHRASRRLYPSSAVRGGTRGNSEGRGGMKKPRRIKAIAGNSASCLGFSIALFTGSIPAASKPSNPPLSRRRPLRTGAALAFSGPNPVFGTKKRPNRSV